MSCKYIGLIDFNETRVDLNINNSIKIAFKIAIDQNSYDIVRNVGPRSGRGVIIYLRCLINYKSRHDPIPSELEAVCVKIIWPHIQPFLVTAIYRPPNLTHNFFESFEEFIKMIDDEN